MPRITSFIRQNADLFLFITLMFCCRSSIADWYHVPTGSMQPTIVEGDRVFVNKAAYRLDVPFTDIPIAYTGLPERGDIVTINSKAAETRLIKRVIGLPGDRVALHHNRLRINGSWQPVLISHGDAVEQLGNTLHRLQFSSQSSGLETFPEVVVPEGHYLVLGDNRNRSADSRVYGFIPLEEISGKATHVIASLNPDNYFIPRQDRFLVALE